MRNAVRIALSLPLMLSLGGCAASQGKPNMVERLGESILQSVGLAGNTGSTDGGTKVADRVTEMSLEEEYFLGRAVAAKIASTFPLTGTTEELTYLAKVGQVVALSSSRPLLFRPYRFGIIDSPHFDAISAPGGYIFVSRGLLESIQDEDQLAAILAHEVMHVAERHALRSIDQPTLDKALGAAGVLLGALSCNELLLEASIAFSATVDEVMAVLLEKGYSRELEFEADAGAGRILQSTGYDSRALQDALQIMKSKGAGGGGGWLSTHPSADDRLSELPSVSPGAADARAARKIRFVSGLQGK